uniref:Putative secreted peptide n=1 Tax=Anopheles braziliensis TaxID=58242 RepID=A0A2M3ZTX0_9DIPT
MVAVSMCLLMKFMHKRAVSASVSVVGVDNDNLVGIVIQITMSIHTSITIIATGATSRSASLYGLCCPTLRYSWSFMCLRGRCSVVLRKVAAAGAEMSDIDRRWCIRWRYGTSQMAAT